MLKDFHRGDDVSISVEVVDGDGNAVDLSGASIKFTLKEEVTDSDSDALIGPVSGSIDDATAGEASVSLSNTQTDIDPGTYPWDIQLVKGDGTVHTVSGRVKVKYDITRAS